MVKVTTLLAKRLEVNLSVLESELGQKWRYSELNAKLKNCNFALSTPVRAFEGTTASCKWSKSHVF